MKILKACCSPLFKILNLAALWLTLFSGMTCAAWADSQLGANVQAQIQALQQEKASFTATEQKMDSQLIFAFKQSKNLPIAGGAVPQLRIEAKPDANGKVKVDIRAVVTPNLLKQIAKAGGTVTASFPLLSSVTAMVPVTELENIAALPGLQFIRPASTFLRNNSDPEGVLAHRDDTGRSNFRVQGNGVNARGLDGLTHFLANGVEVNERAHRA